VIGYLDCTTGVAGDKLLAALVDAGADPDAVGEAVRALDATIRISFEPVTRGTIAALAVKIIAEEEPRERPWRDTRALLEDSGLPEPVKTAALETFRLLAEAEASVHSVSPDDVRFHEVGAIDSIADVVGVAAALNALGLSSLTCGPVSVGEGTVEVAHGVLPVPAPATAMLLAGVPVQTGPIPGEATTPTGAALVQVHATSFGPMPPMTLRATGHGAGTRDTLGVANVMRVLLGDPASTGTDPGADASIDPDERGELALEEVVELATSVDHLSAEQLAFSLEILREKGALDVWSTPAVMKKGRAGVCVTVLASPVDEPRLAALICELTGTLGVRARRISRYVVARESRTVETSFGAVRVKVARTGSSRRIRAEYEDVAAIARKTGLSADRVTRLVETQAEESLFPNP